MSPMNTREEAYHMTEKEMARLKVAERLVEGEITIKDAAEVLGLSTRQVIRIKKGVKLKGPIAVIHGNRERKPINPQNYVYFWVDGVYFNVRLEDEKSCILVIIAADRHGNKELLAVSDSYRESKLSWRELLLDLKKRGLSFAPKLAIGHAYIGDLFMSIIHTCSLCKANPFKYLKTLQEHSSLVAKNPEKWMPWNYEEMLQPEAK